MYKIVKGERKSSWGQTFIDFSQATSGCPFLVFNMGVSKLNITMAFHGFVVDMF